ncbi:cysteine dioxygenase [Streptomyces zingiberis]|uniref:Cysteine dioxygenase n=1 Tax=Streptomyces zingiberis TaxID=2053010 RepID=A0ABX1C1Q5_9ACTN|nr:cysteine dioxygenase family protein [Streptomyces zingiberis]NJQ03827.1 cysteine dioxygenase [Streptomyces zingiberis]
MDTVPSLAASPRDAAPVILTAARAATVAAGPTPTAPPTAGATPTAAPASARTSPGAATPAGSTVPAEVSTPAALGDLVGRFAARRDLWLPRVRFEAPGRYWTRLESDEAHEVWLLTWLPGQGTEIHGHGGSVGAFTVVRGELTEYAFPPTSQPVHPVARRLPEGGLRAFGRRYIHQVTNEGEEPAVSIHAYSPSLSAMSYYRHLPDGRLVVDRTEGVDA